MTISIAHRPIPQRGRLDRREVAAALATTLLAAAGLLVPPPAAAAAPQRIVAAGGTVTEVLYALGLGERIVGVDTTSLFPADALRDKANVGYVRALSAEGVLSLSPTMLLAVEGAGPPDAVKLIEAAGVPVVWVPEDVTRDGVLRRIVSIGEATGTAEPARRLARTVAARFDELDRLRATVPDKPRVLFVLSLQNGRALVGGRGTSADGMLALAGAVNAAQDIQGFKPMTDEAIIAAAPDFVVMMSHASGGHAAYVDELFAMPGFSRTPAAAAKALIRMDGLYLLGFGPRTPEAARDLMAALQPSSNLPKLTMATAP